MATFLADDLEPIDAYKLASGLVVPRPIGWIGTRSDDGTPNLAPFSFFNVVGASPPAVMFCPLTREDPQKDTLVNVTASGEFTHNVVNAQIVEAMNVTAASLPRHVNEFAEAGLTMADCETIDAPRVAEAVASFECKLVDIVNVGSGPMSGNVVIGEVMAFHVADELLDGTRIDQVALQAVGRMAGMDYVGTGNMFSIERPA